MYEMQDAHVIPDATTVEDVYREHGRRLWRNVYPYARDPDIASDAVAEAFAQAIRREAELTAPLAWVTKVAFRVAAGELKQRRRLGLPRLTLRVHPR